MKCEHCGEGGHCHEHENCEAAFRNGVRAAVKLMRTVAIEQQEERTVCSLTCVANELEALYDPQPLDKALSSAEQSLGIGPLTKAERAIALARAGVPPSEPSEASRLYQACIAVLIDDPDWAQNLIIREVPILGGVLMNDEHAGETRYVVEAQVNRTDDGDAVLNHVLLDACRRWTPKPVEVLIRYAGPGGVQLEEAKANHLRLVDAPERKFKSADAARIHAALTKLFAGTKTVFVMGENMFGDPQIEIVVHHNAVLYSGKKREAFLEPVRAIINAERGGGVSVDLRLTP